MCTAIRIKRGIIGRNLDYEIKYGEELAVSPPLFTFTYKMLPPDGEHNAIIGIAKTVNGYPLYFDAINEHGLGCIALSFPESAYYRDPKRGFVNLAPHEVIQYILTHAADIREARRELERINIIDKPYNEELPVAKLHWFISDGEHSLILESTKSGMAVYEDDVGVLTNEPPYPFHRTNIRTYLNLTDKEAVDRFPGSTAMTPYSRGMGAVGLPGDHSSASRFVRAAFTRAASITPDGVSDITEAFHVLASVEQQSGCVDVGGVPEYTQYTSVADLTDGVYYLRTYRNSRIRSYRLSECIQSPDKLTVIALDSCEDIKQYPPRRIT